MERGSKAKIAIMSFFADSKNEYVLEHGTEKCWMLLCSNEYGMLVLWMSDAFENMLSKNFRYFKTMPPEDSRNPFFFFEGEMIDIPDYCEIRGIWRKATEKQMVEFYRSGKLKVNS